MTNLDSEYFDLYKSVDNIVKSAYQNEKGLSYYIEFMDELDEADYQKCCLVPNWKLRRKTLKHLRHIRNQISHDSGSNFASQEEYDKLLEFKNELLNGKDLLAEYRKYNEEEFSNKTSSYYESYDKNDKLQIGAWWLVPIGIIVAFCVLAIFVR